MKLDRGWLAGWLAAPSPPWPLPSSLPLLKLPSREEP